jgi:hypothetical protein
VNSPPPVSRASVENNTSNTTVQNNTATVVNNLNLSANTGGNKASDNGGGATLITTGDATIVANLVNFVNNNITGGGKLVVTVVNVFGSWMGDFVTPGTKKEKTVAQNTVTAEQQATQMGSMGSDTSNSSGSNNSSSTDTATTTQVTPTPSQPVSVVKQTKNKNAAVAVAGSLDSNDKDLKNPQKSVASDEETSMVKGTSNARNKVTINLAYVLLFAPFIIGSVFLQRRYSFFTIMAQRVGNLLW